MLDAPESDSFTASDRAGPDAPTIADALRDSGHSIVELIRYFTDLVAVKVDQLKLSVRNLIIYAILGVLGLFAAVTILVVSVVLLLVGAAHGLGAAMGGRDWAGDLTISILILGVVAIGLMLLLNKFKTASRRRTLQKYEDRRKQEREQFGH